MSLFSIPGHSTAKSNSKPGFLVSAWNALGAEHWGADPTISRHGLPSRSPAEATTLHPSQLHFLQDPEDDATFDRLTKLLTNADDEENEFEDDTSPTLLDEQPSDISHLLDPLLLPPPPAQNFIFQQELDAGRPSKKRKVDEKRGTPKQQRFPDHWLANTEPKRNGHNIIEKRYRLNLNAKISALKDVVPSLRHMASAPQEKGQVTPVEEETSGSVTPQKFNKGTVLEKATEYIIQLEQDKVRLETENTELRKRLRRLEEQSIGALPTPRRSFDEEENGPTLTQSLLDPLLVEDPPTKDRSKSSGLIPMPEALRKFYGFRPNHLVEKLEVLDPPTAAPQDTIKSTA